MSIKRAKNSCITIFVCMTTVMGWGWEGHKWVSDWLESGQLSERAQNYLSDHQLGNNYGLALSEASVWADSVGWSEELHFLYTPEKNCQPFDINRDCGWVPGSDNPPRCIVTAIANYTERAVDVTLLSSDRSEAIKFLLHLMADIHMPFHTGFRSDKGGTKILLSNYNSKLSLHDLWDTNLVKMAIKETIKKGGNFSAKDFDYLMGRAKLTPGVNDVVRLDLANASEGGNLYEMALAMASSVASETTTQFTCDYGYKDEFKAWIFDRKVASEAYRTSRWKVVRNQLLKSSIRIAFLLDQLAQVYFARLAQESELMGQKSNFKTSKKVIEQPAPPLTIQCLDNPYDLLEVEMDLDDIVTPEDGQGGLMGSTNGSSFDEGEAEVFGDSKNIISSKAGPERVGPRSSLLPVHKYEKTLILVKRRNAYLLTSRKNASDRDYFPAYADCQSVVYRASVIDENGQKQVFYKTFTIVFDFSVFGTSEPLSPEQVTLALLAVKRKKIAENGSDTALFKLSEKRSRKENRFDEKDESVVELDKRIEEADAEYTPSNIRQRAESSKTVLPLEGIDAYRYQSSVSVAELREHFGMDPPPLRAPTAKFDPEFHESEKAKFNNTPNKSIFCSIHQDTIFFIAKAETLRYNYSDMRMRFNAHKIFSPSLNQHLTFIIDRNLFDSRMDPNLTTRIGNLCPELRLASFALLRIRPSIVREIGKLAEIFNINREYNSVESMHALGTPELAGFTIVPDSEDIYYQSIEWAPGKTLLMEVVQRELKSFSNSATV